MTAFVAHIERETNTCRGNFAVSSHGFSTLPITQCWGCLEEGTTWRGLVLCQEEGEDRGGVGLPNSSFHSDSSLLDLLQRRKPEKMLMVHDLWAVGAELYKNVCELRKVILC